ncbi:TPA: hypothetical protein ACHO10_002861, partial [Klebsiella michiganensis]
DDIARCLPEAALDAPCPGYRPADGAEPVARLSAARAGEKSGDDIARCFPEAALDAPCPGYRPADDGKPVARLSAARAGEKSGGGIAGCFPEAALDAPCPGYKTLTTPACSMTTKRKSCAKRWYCASLIGCG